MLHTDWLTDIRTPIIIHTSTTTQWGHWGMVSAIDSESNRYKTIAENYTGQRVLKKARKPIRREFTLPDASWSFESRPLGVLLFTRRIWKRSNGICATCRCTFIDRRTGAFQSDTWEAPGWIHVSTCRGGWNHGANFLLQSPRAFNQEASSSPSHFEFVLMLAFLAKEC